MEPVNKWPTIFPKGQRDIDQYYEKQSQNPKYIATLDLREWNSLDIYANTLTVGHIVMNGMKVKGSVCIEQVKIKGDLYAAKATISGSLRQNWAKVDGSVFQNGLIVGEYIHQLNLSVNGDFHQENRRALMIYEARLKVNGRIFRDTLEPDEMELLREYSQGHFNLDWYREQTNREYCTSPHRCDFHDFVEAKYIIKTKGYSHDKKALYPRLAYLYNMPPKEVDAEYARILSSN